MHPRIRNSEVRRYLEEIGRHSRIYLAIKTNGYGSAGWGGRNPSGVIAAEKSPKIRPVSGCPNAVLRSCVTVANKNIFAIPFCKAGDRSGLLRVFAVKRRRIDCKLP